MMLPAIKIYREQFRPSATLAKPYVILGINVVAADTDAGARLLATSGRESFASLRRGIPTTLPPPNPAFEKDVIPFGTIPLEEMMLVAIVVCVPTNATSIISSSGIVAFVGT